MASVSPGVDGFAELTLQTPDPRKLAEFYREVVGLEPLDETKDDRIWLKVGRQSRLGLWSPGKKEFDDQGGRHVHFAFRVARGTLETLRERVSGHGCEVHLEEHPGGDRSLYFSDPEGNRVEAWDFFARPENEPEGVEGLRK